MKNLTSWNIWRVFLLLFGIGWLLSLIHGHQPNSIISFDEGFHGGIALYVAKVVGKLFSHGSVRGLSYLRGEFNNGIIFYPPLWTVAAGFLGFLFGPSTAVFRLTTALFALASGVIVYLFVRKQADEPAATIAPMILLSMPLVFIYSHLMMLEVPLAFGVALAVLGFYWYLTAQKVDKKLVVLVTLGFAVGVQGKVIGIAVIFAALGLYGLALLAFWRPSSQWRRFLAWPTLLFAATALISWYGYIVLLRHFLHADMLAFFLDQSKSIAGTRLGPLGGFAASIWQHKTFYLRDFAHYPVLFLVWFGSLFGYLAWKRTPLAAFLFCYALGVWLVFSGVSPQVVQYVTSIFVPLAIVTALTLTELVTEFAPKKLAEATLIGLTILLVIGQGLSINRSEAAGWRNHQSGQEVLASYVAAHAHNGDRVIAWSDGTLYALRSAGYAKNLQLYNGNAPVCQNALDVSIDWAIVEADGDQAAHTTLLSGSGWQQVDSVPINGEKAYVFRNPRAADAVTIQAETLAIVDHFSLVDDPAADGDQTVALRQSVDEPNIWGCYRKLPLGQHQVTFRLKTTGAKATSSDSTARLAIVQVGGDSIERLVKSSELTNSYQDFTLRVDANSIDSDYEFQVQQNSAMPILIDSVTIH